MAGSPTVLAKLGYGPADPVTIPIRYSDFVPGYRKELKDVNATRGTYQKDGNLVVPVKEIVLPTLRCSPTRIELQSLLKWIMWGNPTGTTTVTYPFADDPLLYKLHWAPKAGEQFFFSGCAVDSATLASASGEELTLALEIVGQTTDDTKSSFPALSLDVVTQPFVQAGLILTVDGSSRLTQDLTVTIKRMINRDRFFNSMTLTDLISGDLSVTVAIHVPTAGNTGLYKTGIDGATILATYTNGFGDIFTMSFSDVRLVPVSPESAQGGEGMLRLEGEAYRSGGTGSNITVTVTPFIP